MIEPQVEPVSMLKAFERDEALKTAEVLYYPNLELIEQEAKEREGKIFNAFTESAEGSVEEEDRARAAAVCYLVLTGRQLQHAEGPAREAISGRFTQASIELYGSPDTEQVALLVANDLQRVESYEDRPDIDQERVERLTAFYRKQLGDHKPAASELDVNFADTLDKVRDALIKRYAAVCEVFEGVTRSGKKVTAEQTAELFAQGIALLAKRDTVWQGWSTKVGKSRGMKANDKDKVVSVGNIERSAERLFPLFAHEVLVHAQRAVNGSQSGSYMAEHGMPNYLIAEEGLAKFVQTAVSEDRQPITNDLYMDIGFALGQLGQPPLTRRELQQIYLDKLIVEQQAQGEEVDYEDLLSKSWSHVNRIYRGSLGNDVIAVNTKDIAYHQGFIKIAHFIQGQLEQGYSVDVILDYLLSARFDPTNDRHVRYLKDLGHYGAV